MELIDIDRTFHATVAEHTFFLLAHGTFSRTDHKLDHKMTQTLYAHMNKKQKSDHKISLNKLKKLKLCVFSKHNGIELEINDKRNSRNNANS
jgi:uncharacterized membrane protein YbaN (DUF454 family)